MKMKTMRMFSSFMLFFNLYFCCLGQHGKFLLKGHVEGLRSGTKVYLKYNSGIDIEDSVTARENYFQFEGSLPVPIRVFVMIKEPKLYYTSFWLENAEVKLKGHIDSLSAASVIGSESHKEFINYRNEKALHELEVRKTTKLLSQATREGDSGKIADLKILLKTEKNKLLQFQKDYIRNNPGSFVSMDILYFLKNDLKKEEAETLFNAMNESVRNSPQGKSTGNYLALFAEPKPGHPAPLFEQTDPVGNLVSLDQFRGKYVLLDFWGSWCPPCIEEMPNLVKLYRQYKEKGFEILAVAADNKRDIWKKSISELKMDWVNLSELKGDQDKVALIYGITYYPANYLIDPKGIIIGKDLRGEKLEKKLDEIFNNRY